MENGRCWCFFLGLTHQDLLAFFSEAPTPRVGTLFFSQNYPNMIVLDCVLGFVWIYHEFRRKDDFLRRVKGCKFCRVKKRRSFLCKNIHTVYIKIPSIVFNNKNEDHLHWFAPLNHFVLHSHYLYSSHFSAPSLHSIPPPGGNTQTDCHQHSNGKNKPSPWVSSHHSESLVSFQYWPVSSATTQISWKCDNLCWNIRSDHCYLVSFPIQ